ncbi:hypothetical protein OF83DRAFT_155167 [Amylostereum chailletii]|nr:hypothetical protein OF83DRAFT_155167 [Amylostereum chailletii]
MKWEMCSYLVWQLTIDPTILRELETRVRQDFSSAGLYPPLLLPTPASDLSPSTPSFFSSSMPSSASSTSSASSSSLSVASTSSAPTTIPYPTVPPHAVYPLPLQYRLRRLRPALPNLLAPRRHLLPPPSHPLPLPTPLPATTSRSSATPPFHPPLPSYLHPARLQCAQRCSPTPTVAPPRPQAVPRHPTTLFQRQHAPLDPDHPTTRHPLASALPPAPPCSPSNDAYRAPRHAPARSAPDPPIKSRFA